MKEVMNNLLNLVLIVFVISFAFLLVRNVNFDETKNSISGYIVHPYKDVVFKEVYSCYDKSNLGSALLEVTEKIKKLKTSYISDVCMDKNTLRQFACKWENKRHYLVSADVNCEKEFGKGNFCFKGLCTGHRM